MHLNRIKFCSLLFTTFMYAQSVGIHFGGWESVLEVPSDTTWRKYQIPLDIIDFSLFPQVPEFFIEINEVDGIDLPDSAQYWLDLVHFPDGYIEMFSDSIEYLITSENGTSVWANYSSYSPDSSTNSLCFGYYRNDTIPINLSLVLSTFPSTEEPPDTVSFWLKAMHSSNLRKYALNQSEYTRMELTDDWRGIHTSIYISDSFSDYMYWPDGDSIELSRLRCDYYLPNSFYPSQAKHSMSAVFIYQSDLSKVRVGDQLWDFDSPLDSFVNGYYLWKEGFEEILGEPIFVKHYGGMLFDDFVFGYGVGLISRSWGGISSTETLVGLGSNWDYSGDLMIDNTVSLTLWNSENYFHNSSTMEIIPPDTNWYNYSIPIWSFIPMSVDPDSIIFCDSTKLIFEPKIFHSNYDQYGRILLDDITLKKGDSTVLIFDDFENGIERWYTEYALNDSYLELALSTDTWSDSSGYSMQIDFGNWTHPHFLGSLYMYLSCEDDSVLHLFDEINLWVKDQYHSLDVISGVNSIPTAFYLNQNFPNPANPSTTIIYNIPRQTNVKITLFDLNGRTIEVLVDKVQSRGKKVLDINVSVLSSGIYFYRLELDGQSITRKMMVLK